MFTDKLTCDPQPPNHSRRSGGNTAFSCSVDISGQLEPTMIWSDPEGQEASGTYLDLYDEE